MTKGVKNIGASVRARLLNISKENKQNFDLILIRFALERLLFRLSGSSHADNFVLKGAMLLMIWFDKPYRGTRDLDLLGFGDTSEDAILKKFRDIFMHEADDGVVFDVNSLSVARIRENLDYGGLRVRVNASIDGARIPLQIDIGFEDTLHPGADVVQYPVMLDFPAPKLRAYAPETVIAEKFQAMVELGRLNSRMKDFYDIWIISQSFSFDNDRLAQAIAATFDRRETQIPIKPPDALTSAFATDAQKQRQWKAFIKDVFADPISFEEVSAALALFLMPHAVRASKLNETGKNKG